jgi:hypothetical protein
MYDQKVPNAWCPHCGFNADIKVEKSKVDKKPIPDAPVEEPVLDNLTEEEVNTYKLVDEMTKQETTTVVEKAREQNKAEDRLTETHCKDGGWWNPITKKCMGTGNGFNIDYEKI